MHVCNLKTLNYRFVYFILFSIREWLPKISMPNTHVKSEDIRMFMWKYYSLWIYHVQFLLLCVLKKMKNFEFNPHFVFFQKNEIGFDSHLCMCFLIKKWKDFDLIPLSCVLFPTKKKRKKRGWSCLINF